MCAADVFATCSRDKTVRVWREAIGGVGFACSTVCVGHESFVTALAFAPDASSVVSGGRDKTLVAWDPATGDARGTMRGHALDVTAVCVLPDGRVVSGSMDKSIKIFDPSKSFECVETFENAHDSSVLALVALPDAHGGGFLSGSADATIRAWKNTAVPEGRDGAVFGRHADTVRGLSLNKTLGLVLSASHDTTARAWTPAGAVVAEYRGHSALVYAVASSACGARVVTGSEDDTARIWLAATGECAQVIPHPGCVWSVAYLPRAAVGDAGDDAGDDVGDVVTCCADGSVRVWSASIDRVDAEAAKSLDDFLVARRAERAARSLEDAQSKLKLEPPSALMSPGDRDGATKVVKEEGGGIAAYTWNASGASWERLGEVTGVGDGAGAGKKMHAGREYDYVFDVDFKDGAPPLKLPFNDGDNPYAAAEQFLETSGLPMEYREQVVNFIVQNVGSANVAQGANVDPFTGAGAYVPGGAPSGGGFGAGGGGYGGSHDPFTGGGAYVPSAPTAAAAAQTAPTFKYLPMRTPVAFETAKYDGILRKLSEFGAEEGAAGEVAAACNGGDPPGASSIAALAAHLESWPVDKLFPLLDLCRMAALRGDAAGVSREVASAMAAACARSVAEAPRLPANVLTAGRLFCNAFRHEVARDAFALRASEILVRPRPEPRSEPRSRPVSRPHLAFARRRVPGFRRVSFLGPRRPIAGRDFARG